MPRRPRFLPLKASDARHTAREKKKRRWFVRLMTGISQPLRALSKRHAALNFCLF
jgi:hypothetical protein